MPSWKELKRYCDRDGWELYRETDHYYYRKILPDGTVYRTKFSEGSSQIGPALWKEIMKRQLHTIQDHFISVI